MGLFCFVDMGGKIIVPNLGAEFRASSFSGKLLRLDFGGLLQRICVTKLNGFLTFLANSLDKSND